MRRTIHVTPGRLLRAAVYARYSSDLQRDQSIEDQLEICHRFCAAKGWEVVEVYADRAQSGADGNRAGFLKLQEDTTRGRFEVVVAESVDRLSRQLSAVGGLVDHLDFHRVKLYAVNTGEVTALMAGTLGSIGQHYLEELRHRTRRGLLGKVLAGLSAGGLGTAIASPWRPGEHGRSTTGRRRWCAGLFASTPPGKVRGRSPPA
ncbi:recombinase family protein [Azospirillum sp. RWY-5-1]|uniref:Recombinase family protein n=1 Tax=Azospirillum oleiclasticum TaxID=2735135 RepID=A0ABX2TCQ5_9PROT|nr:recombinase family protein [Azospirillum oleiclasticum]NYZ14887.1 recombinase family protein [Azospirillum oleiclasticum]NYZ22127.1 recombinase family protein [Azospirillum oleiclasticum]